MRVPLLHGAITLLLAAAAACSLDASGIGAGGSTCTSGPCLDGGGSGLAGAGGAGGSAGKAGAAGSAGMGGAAGSAGKGGAAGSAGATGKGGSTGTAGAGGSAGKGGAAGSAGAAGSGGQAGGAGQGGVGGGVVTATATATATLTVSSCPNSVKNKGTCAPGDDPCFNFCGPDKLGTKLCTCTSRAWDCQTCTFDAGVDYSCYRLPDRPRACAEEPVRPGEPCSFPACTPCGGVDAYLDSSNEAKDGYCVCSDLSTKRKWTCATVREWPPQ